MQIRGLKAALNASNRYKYRSPELAVDHLVIGGGVVGLAVARALTLNFPNKTTYLVERNGSAGEETSSRNSEVIHAGLYYPPNSLKESLCIRGRCLLYQYCDVSSVPYRKTGKLVVAKESQRGYIESLYKKVQSLSWPEAVQSTDYPPEGPPIPADLISGSAARELEPDLSPEISAALLSHETGIIDSHSFMESLERDIMESENGELVYSTSVVRVDPYDRSRRPSGTADNAFKEGGWVAQMVTRGIENGSREEVDTLFARRIINASGLSGSLTLNSLLPPEERIPMYYARGSYAAYNGPGVSNVKRLLYPCPETGSKSNHAFQSLGTHLTLDLNGNIKFGPDIQWISPSGASEPTAGPSPVQGSQTDESFSDNKDDIDFWKQHLIPDNSQLVAMAEAVKSYLPGVERSSFRPDYVGIRPKLVPPWGGFQDFVFRVNRSSEFLSSTNAYGGKGGEMISLLGIESPGLTASLAIAEKVGAMLKEDGGN
ncbi:NAD dehydrogenase [Fomitiporia mediterranea MF3/22]|uniref:NAD dehydrogenase n=1 Tax=Fomitiporia mediterranea (strain MF3/22) TaxID=694068 RepID=UPI0004407CAD|nr:NAD dehydrogenase [Fomitiporia mediterranea MF3/22]EJD01297.1 NAD dehydrogenase [Fomitiporia mediterranea MF3/22]